MPEYLEITPYARCAHGSQPFLLRLADTNGSLNDDDIHGAIVNADGTVIQSGVHLSRKDVRKACRAILTELPSGKTVLVPV